MTVAPATPPTEAEWVAALDALRTADEVALACHLDPDGDAIGSLLGLLHALRALGRPAVASFGSDPFVVPPVFAGLPGIDRFVPPADFPAAPDLLVTLDTGSPQRLGVLAPAAAAARRLLVIDHHASTARFGTLHLLDPGAAATAVLVEELVRRLGVPLTPEIAAPLYAGLVTDTGSFRYAATSPATHELAARLLATGIRHDLISRAICDTHPIGYLRLLGAALDRVELEPAAAGGLGLVWTFVSAADITRHAVLREQVEGVIDVVRTVDAAEVAVVVREDAPDRLHVSLRSKGRLDMAAVAVALGGGGHRFAAGFTSAASPAATIAAIRDRLAAAPRLPP